MDDLNIDLKISKAYKWSTISEIVSRLVAPITNMILARILSPAAFGIVAIATMVTSFAEIFTDSGFQKYLIQNEFKNSTDRNNKINLAFFMNITLSILIFIFIFVFRNELADRLGNSTVGLVLVISAIEIPLSSFFSIQTAILKREFQYKVLFFARVLTSIIPFFVTIPLALLGFNYWSIIIGHLISKLVLTIFLVIKVSWKPSFKISLSDMKGMFSFIFISTLASVSVWFSAWLDSFFISQWYDETSLGLYRQSIIMVNAIFGLFTASLHNVLYSALSRLQNDTEKFNHEFFKILSILSLIVFPLGTLLFIYSDLSVYMILGPDWVDASRIFGVWAVTSIFRIIFVSTFSEYFRAKGKPILNFIIQFIDIIVIAVISYIFIDVSLNAYANIRSLSRFIVIIPSMLFAIIFFKIDIVKIIKAIIKPLIFSLIIMAISIILLKINNSYIFSFLWLGINCLLYLTLVLIFSFEDFKSIIDIFKPQKKLNK